jgi:hypothetical protein
MKAMLAEPPAPRQTEASPVAIARLAGLLYVVITIAAPFGELYVRGKLVVKGDAAATATNILAHESLYRLGGCADLLAFACDAAVALLFYALFKPAGRNASLLAAFFRLMHAVIVSVATLAYFAPLLLLQGTAYLNVFNPDQLQALALVCLRLHGQGYAIGLLFFGVHCAIVGYLVLRSTFLPRILGGLMALAGLCYLLNSFASFLAPMVARQLFPWILLPALPAELGLTLWLLVKGVNVDRWKQQAGINN